MATGADGEADTGEAGVAGAVEGGAADEEEDEEAEDEAVPAAGADFALYFLGGAPVGLSL